MPRVAWTGARTIFRKILKGLRRPGTLASVTRQWDQLASDEFVQDLGRISWTGIPQVHLNHNFLVTGRPRRLLGRLVAGTVLFRRTRRRRPFARLRRGASGSDIQEPRLHVPFVYRDRRQSPRRCARADAGGRGRPRAEHPSIGPRI